MVDEGVCDFLLQLRNEIIKSKEPKSSALRRTATLFSCFFIADNDLIREAVLAVITDFVTDFFVTQIQLYTEASSLQFGSHFTAVICLIFGDIHNHHLNRRQP